MAFLGNHEHSTTVLVLVAIFVTSTFACDNGQFSLKIRKLTNCVVTTPSVVALESLSVTLDSNCQLMTSGCISYKAFSTADVSYELMKDSMIPMQKKFNGCNFNATIDGSNFIKRTFNAMFPHCPVAEGKLCGTAIKAMGITRYLPPGAGRYVGKISIKHDVGTSCFIVDAHVIKADEALPTRPAV